MGGDGLGFQDKQDCWQTNLFLLTFSGCQRNSPRRSTLWIITRVRMYYILLDDMTALDCQMSCRGRGWRDYVHLKIDNLILIYVNLFKLCKKMKIKMSSWYSNCSNLKSMFRTMRKRSIFEVLVGAIIMSHNLLLIKEIGYWQR